MLTFCSFIVLSMAECSAGGASLEDRIICRILSRHAKRPIDAHVWRQQQRAAGHIPNAR